jgi:hypothetical protein
MRRVADTDLTERLNLPLSKALIRAIDEWRRYEPDIPARATAARRLIEIALASVGDEGKLERKSGQGTRQKPRGKL